MSEYEFNLEAETELSDGSTRKIKVNEEGSVTLILKNIPSIGDITITWDLSDLQKINSSDRSLLETSFELHRRFRNEI